MHKVACDWLLKVVTMFCLLRFWPMSCRILHLTWLVCNQSDTSAFIQPVFIAIRYKLVVKPNEQMIWLICDFCTTFCTLVIFGNSLGAGIKDYDYFLVSVLLMSTLDPFSFMFEIWTLLPKYSLLHSCCLGSSCNAPSTTNSCLNPNHKLFHNLANHNLAHIILSESRQNLLTTPIKSCVLWWPQRL